MRPINQPLVHGADENLVASSPHSDNAEDQRGREARGKCDHDKQHHVRAALAFDNGEQHAMYAQNGDALDGGGLAQPLLAAPVKRRRSEDGERTKRARGADVQRGCESDGDVPSVGAQSTAHHHHHHHHHKKAAPTGADADHQPSSAGDVHGVCTLEEGSLKLKISLHRPLALIPDGLSATGKPPGGDKAADSSWPQSPLAKPGHQRDGEEELALSDMAVPETHSPAAQPTSPNAGSAVQKVEAVFPLVDSDTMYDMVASASSPVAPLVVRKVELPKAPSPQEVASELSTKDSLSIDILDTSTALLNNAIQVEKQEICSLKSRHPLSIPASKTALSTPAATATSKVPSSEPNTDLSPSIRTPGNHAIPKELLPTIDTCAREHSAVGGRTRKNTTPGHYVAYQAPHNRRRLIQDTSKLRSKMRSPIDFPAPQSFENRKSPQSFHHVHVSVGQNGGRGFVNHNSILDHPSVHARMFPPGATPARLAALLTTRMPQEHSAAKPSAVQSKAGTSSDEHQPLDLSRAVNKPTLSKISCLAQTTSNYVPPIMMFYMRSGSRQRLEGIVKKLWEKRNIPVRGRPRP
ncbi:uncharacterized protein LOC142585757 [Dermacentor variabilis]|uniref:uncharacterized protein LOC142585757 n=1 Tax=Dermacentor variabilis TaxID=34621 RepID=UPI003F5BCDF5